MRCEDFPCCGHYESSTGDIFCNEVLQYRYEDPRDRAMRLAAEDAARRYDVEQRQREERERYDAAPTDCETWIAGGGVPDSFWVMNATSDVLLALQELDNVDLTHIEFFERFKQIVGNVQMEYQCGNCKECIAETDDNRRMYEDSDYARYGYDDWSG